MSREKINIKDAETVSGGAGGDQQFHSGETYQHKNFPSQPYWIVISGDNRVPGYAFGYYKIFKKQSDGSMTYRDEVECDIPIEKILSDYVRIQ